MRILLIAVIAYLVIRYLLRPLLMAFVVKTAGKMMEDIQNRSGAYRQNPPEAPSGKKKPGREVQGDYVDYEEVK